MAAPVAQLNKIIRTYQAKGKQSLLGKFYSYCFTISLNEIIVKKGMTTSVSRFNQIMSDYKIREKKITMPEDMR